MTTAGGGNATGHFCLVVAVHTSRGAHGECIPGQNSQTEPGCTCTAPHQLTFHPVSILNIDIDIERDTHFEQYL